ncbi:unnamed protein product [Cylindrotheca closterium]|uniref:Nitroreductase domain-containing protein n=1 Tax=Cylindrotheca closterium TaxID=2856 RepID=A0AAD2FGG8_9STRA|nr:unnamed protein product [Cylindrotheca closterium]
MQLRKVLLFCYFLASSAEIANGFFLQARRARKAAKNVQDIITSRRTINEFEESLPTEWEDVITKGIEAACQAPNHKRTEPWRFHLLGQESVRNVCELNAKLVAEKKGQAAGDAKLKRWLAMPGWMVVTCLKQEGDGPVTMEDPMGLAREDYAACCCAVQNFCLSLHAHGMGTKWTTGPVNFDDEFSKAVGLSSDEFVVGTIWFGRPVSQPMAPTKKKSMDDILIRHS